MNRKIKYELWVDAVLSDLEREVCIWFKIPVQFATYDKADKANSHYYINAKLLDSGEVVFCIYERKNNHLLDTVYWKEYWKYECRIMNPDGIRYTLKEIMLDENLSVLGNLANMPCATEQDYLPYAEPFTCMYRKLGTKYENISIHRPEYTTQSCSYMVRAVIEEGKYHDK